METLRESRAFLVQLTDETDAAAQRPVGRIEHVESGRRGRFYSREELWTFIGKILSQQAAGKEEHS